MLYPQNYPKRIPDEEYYLALDYDYEILDEYFHKVNKHIAAVQEAGKKIGVAQEQLEIHDLSKYSKSEFGAYAMHFYGGGAPNDFSYAWLHHLHSNEHHWQHWVFPDGFNLKGSDGQNGVLEMPERFALEMISDWMGASIVYSNTDDMSEWLKRSMKNITLHTSTASYVRAVLASLDGRYKFVDNEKFKHELYPANVASH